MSKETPGGSHHGEGAATSCPLTSPFTAPTLARYFSDPAFRDEVEQDRALRQAEVYAKMDAGIARYWAAREAEA